MGTQGPGRKRIPNREKLTAEDDALHQIAREAEARLAAKRAARAEAREIRMKELERQQKESEELHHGSCSSNRAQRCNPEQLQGQRTRGTCNSRHQSPPFTLVLLLFFFGFSNHFLSFFFVAFQEDSERYSRHSRRHASMSDDEERMSVGSRGSLRSLVQGQFSPASPVVEERPDRDFLDKGSRTASTLSAATLASLGGASSRRGSCDTSFSVETEASIREIKDSLAEAEDRYRKAMVSNAQLHNDKSTLMYQVLERERQAHSVLQFQFKEMKETLRQTEELLTEVTELRVKSSSYCREASDLQEALQWKEKKIAALERQREISDLVLMERDRLREEVIRLCDLLKKHGVVVSPDITINGETGRDQADDDVGVDCDSRLAEDQQRGGRESMLELRLNKLFEERQSLQEQVRLLKSQLDQRQRSRTDGVQGPEEEQESGLENGTESLLELQRDANRQISDLKFKLVKSEQEVVALEQNVVRLEAQVSRYKLASEKSEKMEDELKVEKRKLQRELRSALDRVDELELSNSHLNKRLEKMKANRSALLAQQ
ncbi:hypothetical protein INR49_008806 [Caranx melampygus]|nr:hypothetical protein INR49_008806 [Caranx melampygus]